VNIIRYDIEVKRANKQLDPLLTILMRLIEENYTFRVNPQSSTTDAWNSLPHEELKSIISPSYLLSGFNTENTKVFLFKNFSDEIVSNADATITVIALSEKEINYILKSSYLKIKEIFCPKVDVNIIDGTYVNIYPFDSDKNDVINPHFYIKANFDKQIIKLLIRDWVKLGIITLITAIFIILFFKTPTDLPSSISNKVVNNDMKTVYSAVMSFGISVILLEVITNLLIPYIFKPKHPKVLINNFANIIENSSPQPSQRAITPIDPNNV
jgi:hypothetical protein